MWFSIGVLVWGGGYLGFVDVDLVDCGWGCVLEWICRVDDCRVCLGVCFDGCGWDLLVLDCVKLGYGWVVEG